MRGGSFFHYTTLFVCPALAMALLCLHASAFPIAKLEYVKYLLTQKNKVFPVFIQNHVTGQLYSVPLKHTNL
jgi:hypothetical protein